MKRKPDRTAVERMARMRASGRRTETALRDPAAIAALDRLVLETGSIRAAIEHALKMAR